MPDTKIVLAQGRNRHDTNFVNVVLSKADLKDMCSRHIVGPKDGKCILQGRLVASRRIAKNMDYNSIVMLDIDTGMTLEDLEKTIQDAGVEAFIWSTHSHMKDTSAIKESALLKHCERKGIELGHDDEDVLKACLAYLRDIKRYEPSILKDCSFVGRHAAEGGVEYTVRHQPMEKYRVLFLLSEPFSFSQGGTQQDRIQLWKKVYANLSEQLGIPYDRSCTDPSRLMYLPRVPSENSPRVTRHIEGAALDLMQFVDGDSDEGDDDDASNPFVAAAGGGSSTTHTFATPNLLKFVAAYPDFEIEAWLDNVGGDDRRDGGPASGGTHWTCPNEENHTDGGTPEDKAFAVFSGDGPDGSWSLSCRHDTCLTMSGGDRLWYLDKLCQKYGVEDAMELKAFSETAQAEADRAEKSEDLANDGDALQKKIDALFPGCAQEAVDEIVEALLHVELSKRVLYVADVGKKTKIGKTRVNAMLTQLERDRKKKAKSGGNVPPPRLDGSAPSKIVHSTWSWDDQIKAMMDIFIRENALNPSTFTSLANVSVRVKQRADGLPYIEMLGQNEWFAHLSDMIKYQTIDPQGATKQVPPSKALVQYMDGTGRLQLPLLRGVATTPMFNRDGVLKTTIGYDPSLEMYLVPNADFLPVPSEPTEEQLDVALSWLLEAVRDFPFSDDFEGHEERPQYLDEKDEDGYPLVNLERGHASRMNALAMILGPQVRALFDGPCPAFHIDKPAPGSGAGFLVDVAALINTGYPAQVMVMSKNQEEFRKSVTSALRGAPPLLFVDNINHYVDSGDLAAAITSGIWKDRLLGQSEMLSIPVQAEWILAGNNFTMSDELLRRMVPILLDASCTNPALRPSNAFKHNPLQEWILEYRAELVWSCHVLIANWLAKGRPNGKNAVMNSFDGWTRTMGGIFEAAGLDGLLTNRIKYIRSRTEESLEAHDTVQAMFENFGFESFTTRQLLTAVEDPSGNGYQLDIPPLHNAAASGVAKRFEKWLTKHVASNVFEIPPEMKGPDSGFQRREDEKLFVKVVRGLTLHRGQWQLMRVKSLN